MIMLVIAGYSMLAVYDFVPLFRQKLWKDFSVNLFLAIISLTLAILLSLGVNIPSPLKPVREIVTSITGR